MLLDAKHTLIVGSGPAAAPYPDMAEDSPKKGSDAPSPDVSNLLDAHGPFLEWIYAQSQAGSWSVPKDRFRAALEKSVKKGLLTAGAVTQQKLEQYLRSLHLADFALAIACSDGCETAWEHFFATYRPYLRTAAAAILRCSSGSPEACDLADSLFSDLYGMGAATGAERSLFRYFHGRSSLRTWLRAVLAQRHIDSIRAGRRFEELPGDESADGQSQLPIGPPAQPSDPHRERYISCFTRALQTALAALQPSEKERLRFYYAEEKTLAEIGRHLGEHESSVSRHLDRVRRDLRKSVEEILRQGIGASNGFVAQPGLSDAEIALCLEYSAGENLIDLEKLLPRPKSPSPAAGKRTS